jgi:hypothetical protein
MRHVRKTITTSTTMVTALAGAALVSGWMSIALAGGGRWTG